MSRSRPATIHQPVVVSLMLACAAAGWWGCSAGNGETTTESTSTGQSSSSSGSGTGGSGGTSIHIDGGGGGGEEDSGACVSVSAEAKHVQLDIVFLIDVSGSMSGPKWIGTTSALTKFFNDPASANIGAGMVFFPTSIAYDCDPTHYETLNVPINVLPANAFALTNAMPADAKGVGTPTYGALKGALLAATAHQEANPTHKVILVLATDGDPNGCGTWSNDDIANLAKSARNFNGVHTYTIGVSGSTIANLDKIAVAGGTVGAYDITHDISLFSAKMAEIRSAALGCEFALPPPPNGKELDPNQVNFSYTPKGVGQSKILLRADDLADCQGKPGWYYNSNAAPTQIILCPASCATVQADTEAKVSALFGCNSLIN